MHNNRKKKTLIMTKIQQNKLTFTKLHSTPDFNKPRKKSL